LAIHFSRPREQYLLSGVPSFLFFHQKGVLVYPVKDSIWVFS